MSSQNDPASLPVLWEADSSARLEALKVSHETCMHDVSVDLSKLCFRLTSRLRTARGYPFRGRPTPGANDAREFLKDTRESLALIAARLAMFEEQLDGV